MRNIKVRAQWRRRYGPKACHFQDIRDIVAAFKIRGARRANAQLANEELAHIRRCEPEASRQFTAADRPIEIPVSQPMPHPCDSCDDRPCLASCPAGAVSDDPFDVAAVISGPQVAPPSSDRRNLM